MPTYFSKPDIPQYSISLFSDAAVQGAQAGNAIPGVAKSIYEGVNKGIQNAQSIEYNDLQIQKAKQQVIQETAESYQLQLQQSILQANSDATKAAKTAELEAANLQAIQKRDDIVNSQAIGKLITDKTLPVKEKTDAILSNSGFQDTLFRDPDRALQVLGALEAQGADKNVITAARNQFDAVRQQKQQMEDQEYQRRQRIQNSEKNRAESAEATSALGGLPGFMDAQTKPGYDYRNVNIYPVDSVELTPEGKVRMQNGNVVRKPIKLGSTTPGYMMIYGDEVIEPFLSEEAGKQYQKYLNTYKVNQNSIGAPTPAASTQNVPANVAAVDPRGPAVTPTPSPTNQNIIDQKKGQNQQAFAKAESLGQGAGYQAMVTQGRSLANKQMPAPNFIITSQSTPIPAGTPQLTVAPTDTPTAIPTATPSPTGTIAYGEEKLSQVLGGPSVKLNVSDVRSAATPDVITRINGIEALKDQPAILKGMAAVESSGRTNAVGGAGVGLFQFEPAAASDVGLALEDRSNPDRATPAAVNYLSRQYQGVEKALNKVFNQQGVNRKPDPRFVLAAYNGGLGWIERGIRAGHTDWDSMKEYLRSVKNPTAGRINTEYPDKVILASMPFIVGGNMSDDDYVRTLINFGIAQINI